MARRVGICAVAQTTYEPDKWYERFQGMALEVLESIQAQTGVDFSPGKGIGMSISVSDDIFDARTISDNAMTDVLGAHFGCEEKVAQEGIQAVARQLPIDAVEVTTKGFRTTEYEIDAIPYPKVATDDAHTRQGCGRGWVEMDCARDKDNIIRAIKNNAFWNCYAG